MGKIANMTYKVYSNVSNKLANCAIRTIVLTQLPSMDGPKKVISNIIDVTPLISANSAIALVDDRLNGDGAGIALGINDPVLGWIIISVFTTVWTAYFLANKELGGQRKEDGLSL